MSCFEGESAATSEILNNVIRKLPGVPESEARAYVNQALRDFAREADLWRFKDYELTVCAGDQVLDLAADEGIEIKSVDQVMVMPAAETCGCDPAVAACWHEIRQGDEAQCPLRKGTCSPVDEWWYQAWENTGHQRGQIRFARPWDSPHRIRLHLTLLPAEGSDTFPPHLLADHRRAIEAGALGFGYMIPGQDWSDAKLGAFYMQQWEVALLKAEQERQQRALQARLDVRPGRPTMWSVVDV